MALTKFNFNSFDLTTAASKGLAFNSSANGFETSTGGSMVLIKTLTASSSSTLSFVHGSSDVVLDSTYPIYLFKFINIHPATDNTEFQFNGSDDDSSHSYDVTKTTTFYRAYHDEGDSATALEYQTSKDLAQSTGFQTLAEYGNDNDQSTSGELYLFNPSSTTFVKHFLARNHYYGHDDQSSDDYIAGYCNVTAAIDGVQFAFASGNIDAGTIKLYGIKDS